MIIAVIATLVLIGGTTWSAQNYGLARNRVLNQRITGMLLVASAVTLLAEIAYAVVAL
ncbi:hypothetical protein OWR29_37685 [Actinoplanes sp. Pm04-4]|uniref:HIG1 domain-containing protein n=1 Tax=Paractinoplanes pyxinae TaxID=2997416 RepID=A0ABT4BB74_9ACTN|nr:hypothetical protein [Actinoplanes pyxinae]MCY1143766.1 hypothetical protein [Actinoplanes pyxinae]